MKKFIYISLVLIGIISIGSNFIVDSNKIDHKIVSASGTACKWISDTGYGVGPIYYDSSKVPTMTFRDFAESNFVKVIPCNQSVSGKDHQYKAGVLYSTDLSEIFTGTIRAGLDSNVYFKYTNGLRVEKRSCTSYNTTGSTCYTYGTVQLSDTYYHVFSTYNVGDIENSMKYDDSMFNYLFKPTLYTCVCAEY